jgi:hypothetical protein
MTRVERTKRPHKLSSFPARASRASKTACPGKELGVDAVDRSLGRFEPVCVECFDRVRGL